MAKLNLKTLYVYVMFFGAEPKNRLLAPLVGCPGDAAVAYQKALKALIMEAAENDAPWVELLRCQAGSELMGSPEWEAVMSPLARRIRTLGSILGRRSWVEVAAIIEQEITIQKDAWEHRQE